MGSVDRPPLAADALDPDGLALPVDARPQPRQGLGGEFGVFGLQRVAQQTLTSRQSRGHQGPVGVALGAGQGEDGLDRLMGLDGFFHGYLNQGGMLPSWATQRVAPTLRPRKPPGT